MLEHKTSEEITQKYKQKSPIENPESRAHTLPENDPEHNQAPRFYNWTFDAIKRLFDKLKPQSKRLTFAQKRWIVKKLQKETTEWSPEDTNILEDIIHIKQIESINTIPLPESDLSGLHIVLKRKNKLTPKQLFTSLFGEEVNTTLQSKIFERYGFMRIDNLYIKGAEIGAGRTKLHSETFPQVLHHDVFENNLVRGLYHPELTKYQNQLRQAATYFSDSLNFYHHVYDFYQKWLNDHPEDDPEQARDERFVKLRKKLVAIKNGEPYVESSDTIKRQIVERVAKNWNKPAADPGVQFVSEIIHTHQDENRQLQKLYYQFYKQYKPFIYEHKWDQPNQLLLWNDEATVHARGDTPRNDSYLPSEQGLASYTLEELQNMETDNEASWLQEAQNKKQ